MKIKGKFGTQNFDKKNFLSIIEAQEKFEAQSKNFYDVEIIFYF